MPRRKKYPRLPNGFGQIRYLGKNRRNPYGVYPPASEEYDNGRKKSPQALCYVGDWTAGLAVLTSYHAGTYTKGDEIKIEKELLGDSVSDKKIFNTILADYNKMLLSDEPDNSLTFSEVFMQYYEKRFGKEYGHTEKKPSSERNIIAAYKNSHKLHDKKFDKIVANDLQEIIDDNSERLSVSGLKTITTLFNQLYKYAEANDLCEKSYSKFVHIEKDDDTEHGIPFSDEELKVLWNHADNETVEFLLIMCYSGFRISAYYTLQVFLKEKYFFGGIKTESSKSRIVPIHPTILPLVKKRLDRDGSLLTVCTETFRQRMYACLKELGIEPHTPHDCRHTFSRLCEKYKVNENDRKRMLGHSFGTDITNKVYGHRTLEELRHEIEKIEV